MTVEKYDHKLMLSNRIFYLHSCEKVCTYGVIFGMLGRQGNLPLLHRIINLIEQIKKKYVIILISEINFDELIGKYNWIEAFIQICCPRLSIDWGKSFAKPLLNPFEFFSLVLNKNIEDSYSIDNFANDCGPWGSLYQSK